jgi:hemerythrin-like metal-binding protein
MHFEHQFAEDSMEKPSTPSYVVTGHQQIDSQHHELEQLIQQLATVCEVENRSGSNCSDCFPESRAACIGRLDKLLGDLIGFIVTHFSYEEKLMRQLPATPLCREHIERHKWAHAEVSGQLTTLASNLNHDDPKRCALRLQSVVSAWMGAHMCNFDVRLADNLESVTETELAYDIKLAELLEKARG